MYTVTISYCPARGIMALIVCAYKHTLNVQTQLSSGALCLLFCLNLHLLPRLEYTSSECSNEDAQMRILA